MRAIFINAVGRKVEEVEIENELEAFYNKIGCEMILVEVKVEEESLTMTRGGEYQTQMVFRLGSRYEGMYRTPFGEMDLALYCTRLGYDLGDDGGALELSYQLDLNGRFAAMHDMELRLARQNDDGSAR